MTTQSRNVKFAGVPAVKVRDALRNVDLIDDKYIQRRCRLSGAAATAVVQELLKRKYMKPSPDGGNLYVLTRAGERFALASGPPRIPRSKAGKIVSGVLARLKEINGSDYAYQILTLVVYGSYLTNKAHIGDVDFAVQLKPRFADPEKQTRYENKRVDIALYLGHDFSNITVRLIWPRQEVLQHLRGRVRGVSLHSLDDFIRMKKHKKFAYKVLVGDEKQIREYRALPKR